MGAESDVKTKLQTRGKVGRAADETERLAEADSLETMGLDDFSHEATENDLMGCDGKKTGGEKRTWNALDSNGEETTAVRPEEGSNDAAGEKRSVGTESVRNGVAHIADGETSIDSTGIPREAQTQLPVKLNDLPPLKEQRTSSDEQPTAHTAVEEQFMGSDGKAIAGEKHSDFGGDSTANEGGEKASIGPINVRKGTEKGEERKEENGIPLKAGDDNRKGGDAALNGMLEDDEVATTLAAAREKLMSARATEQPKRKKKQKQQLSKRLGFFHPRKVLCKLRDAYVNSCLVAADKGDMMELMASHPGMYYGETVLSRNVSQHKDREREELIYASLSRQASASASRQHSRPLSRQTSRQQSHPTFNFAGNTSTGMTGLTRNTSNGSGGFPRQSSGRSTSVWSSPSQKNQDLYAAGRSPFTQQYQPTGKLFTFGQVNGLASSKSNGVATLPETNLFRPEINNSSNSTSHSRLTQPLQ